MSDSPSALWLCVSPALKRFDRPLFKYLSQQQTVAQWEYCQFPDRPLSIDVALDCLHNDLKNYDHSVHLMGHGSSGLLALLYARRYPEKVRSLTLLAVGVYPAVDWQAHYYAQLQLLRCPRTFLLSQTIYNLFGHQSPLMKRELLQMLEQDLQSSLSLHTLYQRVSFLPGAAAAPMLVCGSQDDVVIDSNLLQGWWPHLKEGDRLWQCLQGKHFFHYYYPQLVSEQILDFWQSVQPGEYINWVLKPANLIG